MCKVYRRRSFGFIILGDEPNSLTELGKLQTIRAGQVVC